MAFDEQESASLLTPESLSWKVSQFFHIQQQMLTNIMDWFPNGFDTSPSLQWET